MPGQNEHRELSEETTALAQVLLLLLLSSFSCVRFCATPWTAAYKAPPSMGFSRQEYCSGVPLPSPELVSLAGNNGDADTHSTLRKVAKDAHCEPAKAP